MPDDERPLDQDYWTLRVFCEVAEQGSVTQAARRLVMSQPGVSMAIRRLEQRYRLPLVARSGGRVVLTEAGTAIYHHALSTLRSAREMDMTLRALRRGSAGRVALAATVSLSSHYLPPILACFTRDHPDVELHVIDLAIADLPNILFQRPIEFAVLPRGTGVVGRRLAVELFHREPVVIVAAQDHPLALTPTPALDELARQRFIFQSRDSDRLALLEEQLRKVCNVQPRVLLQVNMEAAKQLVRAGVGISVMLRCAVAAELARGELSTVQLPGIELYQDLVLVHHHDQVFSPLAAHLIDLIRAHGQAPAALPNGDAAGDGSGAAAP